MNPNTLAAPVNDCSSVHPSGRLMVRDAKGNCHCVLAAKRIDSFRVLVVRDWHGCQPFVVHTFNEQDGGFYNGHYCESLTRAMEVFDSK